MSQEVRKQIEAFRRKLLDLTLRNRMLNYRPSQRLSIEIAREDSVEVLRILVEEGKKMSFVGKPDPPKKRLADDELFDAADAVAMQEYRQRAEEEIDAYLETSSMPIEKMDRRLSTDEYDSILQAKLRTILREANLAREELGINTLFLTLGSLEWCETDERSFQAPLVYIPVKLEKLANGSIRIIHDGSDIGENLPLRHKLNEFSLDLPELDDEKPLYEYFNELVSTIKSRPDWTVHRDAISLSFFNYEKYAMYVDLGGEGWPEDRKPWMDEDVRAMLGTGYADIPDEIGDGPIDPIRDPQNCHEVYDADSSQVVALIRAAQGLSMVIEGPPGTGKSQTITNIIAESVAAGKTVLFVSAKRAAVEVVKRRLTDAGLEDMCLDLHDKLTNRKQFYSEIRRTVGRTLSLKDETERVERFGELRDRLNEHAEAMNTPLPAYGVTPFEAMILLSRLPVETAEDREGRIPFEQIKGWTKGQLARIEPVIRALQSRVKEIGRPSDHPFFGCGISYLDPATKLDLTEGFAETIGALTKARASVKEAVEAFRISGRNSSEDIKVMRTCLELAKNAPMLKGVDLQSAVWRAQGDGIRSDTFLIEEAKEYFDRCGTQVKPEAWSTEINPQDLATWDAHSGNLLRSLNGDFRRTLKNVSHLVSDGVRFLKRGEVLAQIMNFHRMKAMALSRGIDYGALFGETWKGIDSDTHTMRAILDWVQDFQAGIESGAIPEATVPFLESGHFEENQSWLLEIAETDAQEALTRYRILAAQLEYSSTSADSDTFDTLIERVQKWADNLPALATYINFAEARRQALEAGLQPVVDLADRWPLAAEKLSDAVLRSYYLGIVREAMDQRPALKSFERANHEQMIREFRDLDDFKLKYNRARVRIAHHRRMPTFDQAAGNLRLLKVQCELQRSHKPIRWIMNRAGEAVQKIKPVFMMSPLSVAIHLPPELPPFDLVIFDEASQVKPEDALCAIVRAKQTIVVGDTKQMPPTNFFDRVGEGDDIEAEDEEMEIAQESAKLESILSLMSSVVLGRARRPDLQWHYRSIHPGLIQPSNEMFYDRRLIVFPSADSRLGGSQVGTVFHHLKDTVYEAGSQKRINRKEAEAVANSVLRHVQTEPHLSLMVAAMNKPQADLIYQEVQKRERQHPEAFAAYKPKNPSETIDIKNLETVQGDERDVVFISITYGRDEAGVIRQHFGPILKDGGERRLNVLISRARRRCEVFSNLTSDDIKAEAGRVGLVTLKRYLEFAEHGRLDVNISTGMEEESPFEEEVSAALRARGYDVDTQVGSAGFRIDLAVTDPEHPGRYLLGIECDGATYHSARSARDRDKLREEVLRERGWRLHRIWSHDWWQDKEAEIARLLAALEAEHSSAEEELETDETFLEEPVRKLGPVPQYSLPPPPAERITDRNLAAYATAVVRDEGPIHIDLLMLRLRDAQGFTRIGPALRVTYETAIGMGVGNRWIRMVGDGYIRDDAQMLTIRDWSDVPDRKPSFVTGIELRNALLHVVRSSYGVAVDEAPKAAWVALGFKRIGADAVATAEGALQDLVKAGQVRVADGQLFVTA